VFLDRIKGDRNRMNVCIPKPIDDRTPRENQYE
jgi:hypothetical protein